MTKSEKKALLLEFKPVSEALKENYMPRNNHLIKRLNEVAMSIGAKTISIGCGPCIMNDAKAILKALKAYDVKEDKD